jgi:MFS family permease
VSPPALRHNLGALGVDYALFLVGLSFASQATILPAFAAHLGASSVVIGAIPAVMTLGWWLPSLFTAGYTQALARKLPFVLRWTVWERAPFAVLAGVAFLLADRAPDVALAALLLMLLVVTGVGGALMPAWMDIVGRVVPVTLRGRFFALSSAGACVAGLAGSLLTARILEAVPAPASYGYCFVCATVCMGLSYAALTQVREPADPPPAPGLGLRAHLARLPALLRGDGNLGRFLAARALGIVGNMAAAFYTVHALATWAPPAAQVGVFTGLYIAGQLGGNLAFGWLADRLGHRVVIMAGGTAALGACLAALGAPTLSVFGVVFVLTGLQVASVNVSNLNVLLEFAPTAEERPTYVGLGTTLLAPVAFAAPIAAGLLVEAAGMRAMFAAAATAGALALGVLLTCVRDPRHARATPVLGEARP